MQYYILVRNLKGEVNPGKAIITSSSCFKRFCKDAKSISNARYFNISNAFLKQDRLINNYTEYWMGPYEHYEYKKAIEDCEDIDFSRK